MTTLFCSILATALVARLQGGAIQGKVVDDQGKLVADARVVYFAERLSNGVNDPVQVEARTDDAGQFQLAPPLSKRRASFSVWAYRPGLSIAFALSSRPPLNPVLRKPQQRTVRVEGPDGQPVPGAILSPRTIYPSGMVGRFVVPEAMANLLSVTTGPDGTATINYLAGGEKLVTARLTAPAIGTQVLQLMENSLRDNQGATIAILLKPTRRLAGRVRNRAGQPVAGQEVEIWSKGNSWVPTDPVVFSNGPVRTRGRRLVPDARQFAGWFLVSGGDPRTGVRADPVEVDHHRRTVSALAAHAPETAAHDPRPGHRPTGQAARQSGSLSVG